MKENRLKNVSVRCGKGSNKETVDETGKYNEFMYECVCLLNKHNEKGECQEMPLWRKCAKRK